MHDGCAGSFGSGRDVVNKLRAMGFSQHPMPAALQLRCHHCREPMVMQTFEHRCEHCGAVHGVTPCHAHGAEFVQCAGPGD